MLFTYAIAKGGVKKTTSAICLAALLAQSDRKFILLKIVLFFPTDLLTRK